MSKENLLKKLISGINESPCPNVTRVVGDNWHEFIIGIGNDHVAYVRMHDEDYKELNK